MDNSSLFSTVKRYLQVSSTVGGLATRMAAQHYLGKTIDDNQYAHALKESLGKMKGPLMKVAQFLATIPDAIPSEYAQELLELQSQAPAMGIPFVNRRMKTELGADWQQHFQNFDLQASAAASLGQVHKAITKDGQKVACKLQYPNMQGIIEADLQQLKIILSLYQTFNKALDTAEVQKEITARLLEELDYFHETEQIHLYQEIFKDNEFVKIPKVYQQLSTKRLLTMEWMEGQSVYHYNDHSLDYRNQLATLLFKAWYIPFYKFNKIHGDPHPGNYLITEDGQLNILDFGCVRHFPSSFIQGVIKLYEALLNNKPEQAIYAYEVWGFNNLTKDLIEVINQWALLLFDPLLDNRVRPIQKNFTGADGWAIAKKVHTELHRLGGICPPQEFVFMDRASVSLGAVFMRLKAELNWHQLFEEIIYS